MVIRKKIPKATKHPRAVPASPRKKKSDDQVASIRLPAAATVHPAPTSTPSTIPTLPAAAPQNPQPVPPVHTTPSAPVALGSPPYPQYTQDQLIATEQVESGSGHRRLWISLGIIVVLCAVYGTVRLLPCSQRAKSTSWQAWSWIAPNLVCSIDLHAPTDAAASTRLTLLPERIGVFRNLQTLDVSGNALSSLPDAVTRLAKLQTLRADHNMLSRLPTDIGALTSLKTLALQNNLLAELPDSITSLTALEELTLSDNRLTTLPKGMDGLANLRILDIERNRLTALPVELARLPKMEQFKTSGNKPTTQSSASSSKGNHSSSTGKSSSKNASIAPSGPLDRTCDRNFTVNSYTLCLPATWIASFDKTLMNATIRDTNNVIVATVTCPISDTAYDAWTFRRVSRTYERDGRMYGTDLWTGTRMTASTTEQMLILFLHRNSFSSWFGQNYSDVGASCQIESKRPGTDLDTFSSLFTSAY